MSQQMCGVCHVNLSKYKCPVCLIKFCCVACYKNHKESSDCIKPELSTDEKKTVESHVRVQYETEDTVPPEKLNLLDFDKNVRRDLENRHLQQLLEQVNSSQDPYESIEEAMKEPLFSEFVRHCLQVVEKESSQQVS